MLWLWWRLAVAAPLEPLVWELPCAACAALKKKEKAKQKKKKSQRDANPGSLARG